MGVPLIGVLTMTIAHSTAEVLKGHLSLELECMDFLYVNSYVPMLPSGARASDYSQELRGLAVPSSVMMAPPTRTSMAPIERFA